MVKLPDDFGDDPTLEQRRLGYLGKISSTNVKLLLDATVNNKYINYIFRKTTSNKEPNIFYLSFIFKNKLFELPFVFRPVSFQSTERHGIIKTLYYYNLYMKLLDYNETNVDIYNRTDVYRINFELTTFLEILQYFSKTTPDDMEDLFYIPDPKSYIHYLFTVFINFRNYRGKSERKIEDTYRYFHRLVRELNTFSFVAYYRNNPKTLQELARANINLTDKEIREKIIEMRSIQNLRDLENLFPISYKGLITARNDV
jgi:hypothetical protein